MIGAVNTVFLRAATTFPWVVMGVMTKYGKTFTRKKLGGLVGMMNSYFSLSVVVL